MSRDPVVIYQAANSTQAHLLQQALARVGFEAWVETPVDNHLGQTAAGSAPRVVVRREDAAEARQIADEFDQLMCLPPIEEESMDEEPVESAHRAGEVIEVWPTCPQCQAPRQAECGTCLAAAEFFPHAFQAEGETHNLRMCPSCDDVFEPRFFRHCHRCNHDFGDGLEPKSLPKAEYEGRAWAALWVMLAGMVLLVGYFSWLFRR